MNKAAFDALIKELPASEPRFFVFFYSLKNAEGRVCDKNLVIKWCGCLGMGGRPPVVLHPRPLPATRRCPETSARGPKFVAGGSFETIKGAFANSKALSWADSDDYKDSYAEVAKSLGISL